MTAPLRWRYSTACGIKKELTGAVEHEQSCAFEPHVGGPCDVHFEAIEEEEKKEPTTKYYCGWAWRGCTFASLKYNEVFDHEGRCGLRDAAPDPVEHPAHYKTASGLEAIEVIEAFGWGFCIANCFKYLARAGKKSPDALTDLKKSRWYLDREIARLEKVKP